MSEKVIGLLGGMGPEATIDIFEKITYHTKVEKNEDHLRVIIDSNPKIPDRQSAILEGTEDPGPAMALTAKNLVRAGADILLICANTAHYFYKDVAAAVDVKVLHLIDETIMGIIEQNNKINHIGILATNAAMKTNIFEERLKKQVLNSVIVPGEMQEKVHDAIFKFKYDGISDKIINDIQLAISHLVENGAEAIILGCTELPLILKNVRSAVPLIDPNDMIAKKIVDYCKLT